MKPIYSKIIEHYEQCLEKHGDNHLGVDWPKLEDVATRYKTMLEIIKFDNKPQQEKKLLDFGCGTAHLLEYIHKNKIQHIEYSGLDISSKFISVAKQKYPHTDFYCGDILNPEFSIPNFDYIIMNGVFTEKRSLSQSQMWKYFTQVIQSVYHISNRGLAFNVMSKNVDWERDDLFHLSFDVLSDFLCKNLTRNFIIRNDYGLYEYTVYIYKS